ncbi:hypothetical protein D1007_55327 [Hordeum vulgare]|nr:hypothetical protein D1007_55327 [Hordeum vulgare]
MERDLLFSVELRDRQALSSIYRLGLKAPLVPQDAGYTELSSDLGKVLEGATKKVDNVVEEECRDVFTVAMTRLFSHLLMEDPHFEFKRVMGAMLEESCCHLATPMGGHVHVLLEKISCDNEEESGEEPPTLP